MRIYKCPDCGNEISEGSIKPVECPICGCPFEKFEMIEIVDEPQPRKFCSKCGSLLPSGQVKFCPNCGYQLGNSATHKNEKQIHKPPVRRRSALHVVLVIIGIIGAAIGSICLENIDFTPPTITNDSQSSSSSADSQRIDATYQYSGEINNHAYNIQLTLDANGGAQLKMLDKPIIESLGDYDLWDLYNDGVDGYYNFDKECGCYHVIPNGDYWYDAHALDLVTSIFIGDDGYLYFSKRKWNGTAEGNFVDASSDVKNHTNRGPKYTKVQ